MSFGGLGWCKDIIAIAGAIQKSNQRRHNDSWTSLSATFFPSTQNIGIGRMFTFIINPTHHHDDYSVFLLHGMMLAGKGPP